MLWKCLKNCMAAGALIVMGVTANALQPGTPDDGVRLAHLGPVQAKPSPRRLPAGPLSDGDAALYHRIFRLQDRAEWQQADLLIERLGDRLLMGHVLYQRYMHPTAYRSTYEELRGWLEQHADHPSADRVYALAAKRRPARAAAPAEPVRGYLGGAGQEVPELIRIRYRSDRRRSAPETAAVQAWRDEIEQQAGRRQLETAQATLERSPAKQLADDVEVDLARWSIAAGYFYAGQPRAALELAGSAVKRSGEAAPEMHWIAGISAWRLGQIEAAAQHFATLARATNAHGSERARAAFWAARAYVVTGKPQLVGHFLGIAASHGREFYGILARAVLGEEVAYSWDEAGLKQHVLAALLRHAGARRAMALGQIGQVERAEDEIRKLAARVTPEVMTGLIALAEQLHLPATQMRLAQRLGTADGRYHHGALFPVPRWAPADGLRLDRALIFSIIRAESAFDPDAESHVGARGLMQVMPGTAKHMAKVAKLEAPKADELFEPEVCITFGQAYLEYLLKHPWIGDNLIYLAAGYNAGPGRVIEWQKSLEGQADPLLFLESIPMREPRVYVKKVLTNLWTYRARLGQPAVSLTALAGNDWPRYAAAESKALQYAQN